MKQHLRVVVEVAALGFIAMPIAVLPALLPCAVTFYYGYRRKLQLHFAYVWIGLLLGWFVFGMIAKIVLMRHIQTHADRPNTSLLSWVVWVGYILLYSLLPALATMWGQRVRLRARPTNSKGRRR